jgi:ankyrin repeat protein
MESVKWLTKKRAKTTAEDSAGLTPLYYSIMNDDLDMCRYLLKYRWQTKTAKS